MPAQDAKEKLRKDKEEELKAQCGDIPAEDIPEQTDGQGSKRKRDDDDDIDDEEEFMLAQAIAMRDNAETVTEDEDTQQLNGGIPVLPVLPSAKKDKRSAAAAATPQSRGQSPPTQMPPHLMGVRHTSASARGTQSPVRGRASIPAEQVSRPNVQNRWTTHANDVMSLQLSSESCRLLQAPKSLKAKDKTKWVVETAKLKTAAVLVESMLCGTVKVKEQEVKTACTALKRLGTDKTDKKVGGDKLADAVKFSTRCNAIRELLSQCKELRAIVMVAGHVQFEWWFAHNPPTHTCHTLLFATLFLCSISMDYGLLS